MTDYSFILRCDVVQLKCADNKDGALFWKFDAILPDYTESPHDSQELKSQTATIRIWELFFIRRSLLFSHLNTQSVPRSKHTPSRLYKPVS